MAAHEIIPWLLTPNTRGWIVAPNYNLGQKVAREVKRIIIRELKLPIESKKEISGDLYFMRLSGLNSEIAVRSADSPESLIGEGIDYLVIDEMALISRDVYEMMLRPTLADRQGWALFCSTPRGFNYFEQLYRQGQDPKHPDWESWQVPSWQSPFFKDDIEQLKRTMTRETFLQEIGSEFTSYAGKVYDFDRFTQVKANLKYDPMLPTYVSIDFGYRTSCAIVCQVRNNPDGLSNIYQIDEIYLESSTTEELAKLVRGLPYHITSYMGDPAGAGSNLQTGLSDFQVFAKFGMRIRSRKDRLSRDVINSISHARRWMEDANGEKHFFVAKRCKKSIQSYENYRYPDHKKDQQLKEMPLKDGINDHIADCYRFMICNLFPIKSRQAGMIDW
tara:strand:- start:3822 stop:4988 length:1167 start_codon:yes stop_codon:yes gene_type:complete